MRYELIYIDSKTKENMNKIITYTKNWPDSYGSIFKKIMNTIKKSRDGRWGIFLADSNLQRIIGFLEVLLENEVGERYSYISGVMIDPNYRGKKLCSMLMEKTFKVLEEKNYGGGVIETDIAGGMPILKCFLRVVSKLKYNIYSVTRNLQEIRNGVVNRHEMKLITAKKALQIERRNYDSDDNYKLDVWQHLIFVKRIPKKQPKKQLKKQPKKRPKKQPKKRPKKRSKKLIF